MQNVAESRDNLVSQDSSSDDDQAKSPDADGKLFPRIAPGQGSAFMGHSNTQGRLKTGVERRKLEVVHRPKPGRNSTFLSLVVLGLRHFTHYRLRSKIFQQLHYRPSRRMRKETRMNAGFTLRRSTSGGLRWSHKDHAIQGTRGFFPARYGFVGLSTLGEEGLSVTHERSKRKSIELAAV